MRISARWMWISVSLGTIALTPWIISCRNSDELSGVRAFKYRVDRIGGDDWYLIYAPANKVREVIPNCQSAEPSDLDLGVVWEDFTLPSGKPAQLGIQNTVPEPPRCQLHVHNF